MAEWFKEWFSSPEYLKVYKHRNEKDALDLISLIRKNVPFGEKKRLIDFACGNGRHAEIFSSIGFRVFAFDLSRFLLNIAKDKSGESENAAYFCADIRNPAIKKDSFDIATSLFSSFGYFQDDVENFSVFSNAFSCLKKGGHFVFDYLNPLFLASNLQEQTVSKYEDRTIIQNRKIEDGFVKKQIIIEKGNEQKIFYESVRLYSSEEILSEMRKCGFEISAVFGDYSGSEFNYRKSSRIIVVAEK